MPWMAWLRALNNQVPSVAVICSWHLLLIAPEGRSTPAPPASTTLQHDLTEPSNDHFTRLHALLDYFGCQAVLDGGSGLHVSDLFVHIYVYCPGN